MNVQWYGQSTFHLTGSDADGSHEPPSAGARDVALGGEEAQLLAGLDRRATEHDALDAALGERGKAGE